MYEIFREASFSGAHRLRGYKGKCESVHGHNWRVRVFAAAAELDSLGMVVDFKILGEHIDDVLSRLDHADLNAVPPFDRLNPSSENVARHIFDEMADRINDGRVRIRRVMVWETDPSCAIYYEE
jgi:6-pyruvoyltetrahydropterin/6-carboxytetrahydropterin synthase